MKSAVIYTLLLQDQDNGHKIFKKGKDFKNQITSFADCEGLIQEEFNKIELKTKTKTRKISKSAMAKESINASAIIFPGLMQSFIATKVPTTDSMVNFWRMIQDKKVRTIVMLTSLENIYVDFKAKYLPTKENVILNFSNGISLELTDTSFHDFCEKR